MNKNIFIPSCLRCAGNELRLSFARPLEQQADHEFVRAWCCVAYLFPGLHPDAFEDAESGWTRVLRPIAAEAWRRAEAGRLADDELYPGDAQWCGLFDRMQVHLPDETQRRVELAASFGEPANA
jgi:hypothetical protein